MNARITLVVAVIGAFVLSSAKAEAPPPDAVAKMVAQSEFVMRCGMCRVALDPTIHTTPVQLLLPPPINFRVISAADYEWIHSAAFNVGLTGLYVMSERIHTACNADWNGPRCLAARALWRQEWPEGTCIDVAGKPLDAASLNRR